MLRLRIGGVPEHFNLPWHLLLESGALEQQGIATNWQDFPAGTGAMVKALNADALDVAIMVTECAVMAQLQADCQFQIISCYTSSPLLWGIHVAAASNLHAINDLPGHRYAISRYGSGSHLMAKVHARSQGWSVENLQYVLVENLSGARQALLEQRADIFIWEHYTTKPYVDNGEFRWLADIPPPWPGFVICVRQSLMDQHAKLIQQLLTQVFAEASQLKLSPNAASTIADRYQLPLSDIQQWLAATEWSKNDAIDPSMIKRVQLALNEQA